MSIGMVTNPAFDPAAVDTSGDITLVLGHRTTSLKGYRIAMHNDVTSALRAICDETLLRLRERNQVQYADDLSFDPEKTYLVAKRTSLIVHAPAPRRSHRPSRPNASQTLVEMDAAVLRELDRASSLEQLDAREITKKRSFQFYAAVVGDDPHARVAFLSKWNPYRAALTGQLLTSFGDRLRTVTGPVLAFESQFDLVVTQDAVAILRAPAFESVFRDTDAMKARIPTWTAALTTAVAFESTSAARLAVVCERNSRVLRQVRSMYERGVFDMKFAIDDLSAEMRREGLDHSRLIRNGELVLEDNDIPDVLKVLDEKFYEGWHSQTRWDVGTRAPRSA